MSSRRCGIGFSDEIALLISFSFTPSLYARPAETAISSRLCFPKSFVLHETVFPSIERSKAQPLVETSTFVIFAKLLKLSIPPLGVMVFKLAK